MSWAGQALSSALLSLRSPTCRTKAWTAGATGRAAPWKLCPGGLESAQGPGVSAGCLASTSVHTAIGAGSGEPCGLHVWSPPASAEHPTILSGGHQLLLWAGRAAVPERTSSELVSESQSKRQSKTEGRPLPLCFRMKLRTRKLGLREEWSKIPKHRLSNLTTREGAGFSRWAKLLLQREVGMQGWG